MMWLWTPLFCISIGTLTLAWPTHTGNERIAHSGRLKKVLRSRSTQGFGIPSEHHPGYLLDETGQHVLLRRQRRQNWGSTTTEDYDISSTTKSSTTTTTPPITSTASTTPYDFSTPGSKSNTMPMDPGGSTTIADMTGSQSTRTGFISTTTPTSMTSNTTTPGWWVTTPAIVSPVTSWTGGSDPTGSGTRSTDPSTTTTETTSPDTPTTATKTRKTTPLKRSTTTELDRRTTTQEKTTPPQPGQCPKCQYQESTFGTHGVLAFAISVSLVFLLLYAILMIMLVPRCLNRKPKPHDSNEVATLGFRQGPSDFGSPALLGVTQTAMTADIDDVEENNTDDNMTDVSLGSTEDKEPNPENDGNVSTFLLRHPSKTGQDLAYKPPKIEPSTTAAEDSDPDQDATNSATDPGKKEEEPDRAKVLAGEADLDNGAVDV